MKDVKHWLATVDGRSAKLLSCSHTPQGELSLHLERSITNTHEKDHEQHRPSSLGGAERRSSISKSSASAAPHPASSGHEAEEEQHRFSHEVANWLDLARRELGFERACIFAAPRFLGLLRPHIDASTDLHEAELTHLSPQQLARHPAVRKWIDQHTPASRI